MTSHTTYQEYMWDFPGGSVVKNPPASAGDIGSIPALGRSHMPWKQLSPYTTITEIPLKGPRASAAEACEPESLLCNKRGHGREKSMQCGKEHPLLAAPRESPHTAIKTQGSQE